MRNNKMLERETLKKKNTNTLIHNKYGYKKQKEKNGV